MMAKKKLILQNFQNLLNTVQMLQLDALRHAIAYQKSFFAYNQRFLMFRNSISVRFRRTYFFNAFCANLDYCVAGDDVSRSLFMFADGKPLGCAGLRWLKIHVINLTGTKKSENLEARLEHAEKVGSYER